MRKGLLRLSSPLLVVTVSTLLATHSAYNLVIVFGSSVINLLGTDSINARSYTLTLTALVTGVILALAQGNETIVGWDVGGGQRRQARRLTVGGGSIPEDFPEGIALPDPQVGAVVAVPDGGMVTFSGVTRDTFESLHAQWLADGFSEAIPVEGADQATGSMGNNGEWGFIYIWTDDALTLVVSSVGEE